MPSTKLGRPSKPSKLRQSHTYAGHGASKKSNSGSTESTGDEPEEDDVPDPTEPDAEVDVDPDEEEDGEEDELDGSELPSDDTGNVSPGLAKHKEGEQKNDTAPLKPRATRNVGTKTKVKKRASEEDPSDLDSEEGDVEVSFSTHKTARQLAADSKDSDSYLQELGRVVKKSKYDGLTESEIALRREENARRRKNQTDQRLEEEKQETINRLLNKQVSRSRNKLGEGSGDEGESPGSEPKVTSAAVRTSMPDPVHMFRYSSTSSGACLSLPLSPLEDESTTPPLSDPYAQIWERMFAQSRPSPKAQAGTRGES